MTAETKLRTLASQDATLQGFFGTNPFRWFHVQLPPGYVMRPTDTTCAEVLQIGSNPMYAQDTVLTLVPMRFQITVLDPNADRVDDAALAIVRWLNTVSFASDAQFLSPPQAPPQLPTNFVISVRPGIKPATKPPIPTQLIDFRMWNLGLI